MITKQSPYGMNMRAELRAKTKSRIDTLITTQTKARNPQKQAYDYAESFKDVTDTLLLFGPDPVADGVGLRYSETNSWDISLLELVSSYVMRIPGNQVVGFCDPGTIIAGDFQSLLGERGVASLGSAWAAYGFDEKDMSSPALFVIPAIHLGWILMRLKKDVMFNSPEWRTTLDYLLRQYIPADRYVNLSDHEIIVNPDPEVLKKIQAKKAKFVPSVRYKTESVIRKVPVRQEYFANKNNRKSIVQKLVQKKQAKVRK